MLLALVVLTFVLDDPADPAAGRAAASPRACEWTIVAARPARRSLPQALGLTIPMALLLGILLGLGRLSADREFVAMQACGVSLFRLLRPIALLAVLATAATAYEMIVALPDANQTFREITFNVVASRAESDVKPRVFFEELPQPRALRPRRAGRAAAGTTCSSPTDRSPSQTTVYFARTGRLLDRPDERGRVQLELRGRHAAHDVRAISPTSTRASAFETIAAPARSGDGLPAARQS